MKPSHIIQSQLEERKKHLDELYLSWEQKHTENNCPECARFNIPFVCECGRKIEKCYDAMNNNFCFSCSQKKWLNPNDSSLGTVRYIPAKTMVEFINKYRGIPIDTAISDTKALKAKLKSSSY